MQRKRAISRNQITFLPDSEPQFEHIIKTAKKYRADFVFVDGLTLFNNSPADSKTLYYQFSPKLSSR